MTVRVALHTTNQRARCGSSSSNRRSKPQIVVGSGHLPSPQRIVGGVDRNLFLEGGGEDGCSADVVSRLNFRTKARRGYHPQFPLEG